MRMRTVALLVALVAATGLAAGMALDDTLDDAPAKSARAAGDSDRTVVLKRPEGHPLRARAVRDGNLQLRPLSQECGLPAVFGTHAEGSPDGAFCRVWVEVVNTGAADHEFDTAQQAVVDKAGARYAPDAFAMAVRRQTEKVRIGGHQLLWLELWFDVPTAAAITGVRLAGDDDPPAYQAISPAPRAPGGVLFPFG